ncbi:hypothetical protein IMX10_20540 [Chryseobacterium culicis]|nr:hypothetical protein [Chryseobacterium culicis]
MEKERIYRFNRMYLLSALLLSYTIPFITITLPSRDNITTSQLIIEETAQQLVFIPQKQESFDWMNVVWGIYISITLFLLLKSIGSILAVKRISGQKYKYRHHNVIVTQENLSPFSFWNTIYMGESYMKNNSIDPRIFLHEKTHIEQKHSLDLLFLELLHIFTWFNPVLFFYKKAVITNHEFLADEAVMNDNYNIRDYQHLILEEILSHQNPNLTHSFNFNNTKKRFIMMNTKKSKFSLLRKAAGIAVLISAAALFSERTYAGNASQILLSERIAEIPAQVAGQDPYQEFKDILAKYDHLLKNKKYVEFSSKVTDRDKKRLGELYSLLSKSQQNEQKITFFATPELKKRVPTEHELKSFLNKQNYAVWIDAKKVENSTLKNYTPNDFSNVYISKVYQNARTVQNPQPYQVTLMTPSYYEKIKEEGKSSVIMGFKREDIKYTSDTIVPRVNNIKESKNTDTAISPEQSSNTIPAQYPGGDKNLKIKISQDMDVSTLNSYTGTITSMAYIHINENGKTTQVTTSGENETMNRELLKTVTQITNETQWKPAMKDGKAIASVLKIPATLSFARP